jgi:endonuclease-8
MAEGDTILRTKHRLEPLAGQVVAVSAPNARGRAAQVERLDGARLERIETHGKNLMLVFGELALHSHLGMSGSWHLYPHGARWRRAPGSAWVVLRGETHEAVQFGGPTLRVMPTRRLKLDPQLARLGPDILAPGFNPAQALAPFRTADQRRTLGEALLDQHLAAGIGNIFKSEACFAVAIDPWRTLGDLSDEELAAVLLCAREQMLDAVANGRSDFSVYHRRGPCSRCGGRVRSRGQGDANRTTWWCERCQA